MSGLAKILNLRLIVHVLGLVLVFEGLFMILDLIACFVYDKTSIPAVFFSILITLAIGFSFFLITKEELSKEPTARDSYVIVTLSWLLLALFGTLPYVFSHSIKGFADIFFETVSGLTTTGSSILSDIESLPKGILFWRSETHWIGGMGIIVLMIAIFPYFKIGGMHLLGAESSVVVFEKLKPRLLDTVKRLWMVYIILTLAEVIMLRLGGMNLFDSICHAFGTVSTGGFSTKNSSLMSYSPYIQYVVTLFMLLSGINFALHYFFFKGNLKKTFRNEELRLYISIIAITGLVVTIYLWYNGSDFEPAFRSSFFQVISIVTATGFSTSDYLLWPQFAELIIFILMFVGGSAGSTSGGIKVVRHLILFKRISLLMKHIIHPKMVRKISLNQIILEPNMTNMVMSFIMIYLITIVIGSLIMSFFGLGFETSVSSVATTLGGIGPGFGKVGPTSNFEIIPVGGKFFLSFIMILGRLEIYTILVIFHPSFWKL